MWNPFQPQGGVALNLLGPGTVDVGGQRAAILICYEQLLTWPMLRSAIEKPTILIAISNEAWTAGDHGAADTTRVRSRMGQTLRASRNFSNQFMRGDPQMQEVLKDNHILTINDVAAILRCSKTHVSHVLAGKIPGIPRLTHIAMGRRKLVRRDWLDQWMESNKQQ